MPDKLLTPEDMCRLAETAGYRNPASTGAINRDLAKRVIATNSALDKARVEVAKLRAENYDLRGAAAFLNLPALEKAEIIARLRTELTAAQVDAERLRWLAVRNFPLCKKTIAHIRKTDTWGVDQLAAARAVIDEEMLISTP